MKTPYILLSFLCFLLAGCDRGAKPPAPGAESEFRQKRLEDYNSQLEAATRQIADYDRQTKKIAEQQERMDRILEIWEAQAKRMDAILTQMEVEHGIKK